MADIAVFLVRTCIFVSIINTFHLIPLCSAGTVLTGARTEQVFSHRYLPLGMSRASVTAAQSQQLSINN